MKKYKAFINIDGKKYKCEIRNGVAFIDGKTVDKFMETMSDDLFFRSVRVGIMALQDEINGIKVPKGKYRYYINEPL